MQNFEKVKQCMKDQQPSSNIYNLKKLGVISPNQLNKGPKFHGLSAYLQNCKTSSTNTNVADKKRPIKDITKVIDNSDFFKTGKNENMIPGRFRFKFQEGHSKNFKRELGFDWFLN